MQRRTKIVLFGLIALFLVMMVSTMGKTTTEKVYPKQVVEGNYDGSQVLVKGGVRDLKLGDKTRFRIVGRYNETIPVVYEKTPPAALKEGEPVVAQGKMKDGVLDASRVTVQSHSEGGNKTSPSE